MTYLRSAVFTPLLVLWTAVFALYMPWLAWRGNPADTRSRAEMWSRGLVRILRRLIGLTYVEIGTENRPSVPALYVANHQSAWETLVFNLLVPHTAIVLKEELYRIPVFGWYLKHSAMIGIDRAGGASAMKKLLREARSAVAEGRSVLIFPEGTRRAPHEVAEFHRGVLLLYKALGLPVVPMALNAGLFWKARSFLVRPGIITVSYLPTIPAGLPDQAFLQAARTAIYTERDRLVALVEDAA